jgi:hypothetical protein
LRLAGCEAMFPKPFDKKFKSKLPVEKIRAVRGGER